MDADIGGFYDIFFHFYLIFLFKVDTEEIDKQEQLKKAHEDDDEEEKK